VIEAEGATAATGWQRRHVTSASIRVAVTLVPVLISFAVGLLLNQALAAPTSGGSALGRALVISVCSLAVLVVTNVVARRFLPLAALMQLSLVFPDQTPSRFRTALKGGSGRRLAREVVEARENGLSDNPSRAAEQLLMLATAIGDHDRRTRGHCERVRLYTDLIAEELHLSREERSRLQWAALIHDIGKIQVPAAILNKKGAPDDREWAVLKEHPLAGERLVAPVLPWLGDAVHAVGGHHERWDGTGYPRGLKGESIPRSAAIVAVADSFEVMTAVRSYKMAMPLTAARAELTRCAGTHFSPDVVRAMLNVSIGRLRRSMGLFAATAHLPFLAHVTRAASFAPDAISTAVSSTATTATAGAGVLALSSGLAMTAPLQSSLQARTAVTSASELQAVHLAAMTHVVFVPVPVTTEAPEPEAKAKAKPEASDQVSAAAPTPSPIQAEGVPAPPPTDAVPKEAPADEPAPNPKPHPVQSQSAGKVSKADKGAKSDKSDTGKAKHEG
jgi:HD-GYP domain-containing protein (c-di-GMP phosphodiesterase class II)